MWKILVVEDNQMNRALVMDSLEKYAECDVAVNGKEAFKIFNETYSDKVYDMYLVDIAMPEMSGPKLLELIKEHEDFMKIPLEERLPIVVVTAFRERLNEVFELGYKEYILKPFDPDDLLEKVSVMLGDGTGE